MMEDKNRDDKIKKIPPIGPFGGANIPKPPVPPGLNKNKPSLPSAGGGVPLPGPGGLPSFGAQNTARPAAKNGEAEKMKEEKEKLEKKIVEMEKVVSSEKEKALMAKLKSQQDEVLSSRVESSLKDMQDKLRRDRHDQEVEDERLSFKAKVQELENKLVQERETWMHTLKGQMSERENQGKDVETHFIYRLQEMERRWLDEKAEWQKKLMSKEEDIIKFKGGAEKLREMEDEFREINFEKNSFEKEVSKLKEEISRLERERASVESYIKIIPEKEREISDFRAELSITKIREEKNLSEFKHREEKLLADIEKLQRDIGSVSDRKNQEKEEEIKRFQEKQDNLLGEKEQALAKVTGEKIKVVSELSKLRGFVSKVQAINAVLEKERIQLRSEKIQMAQNMAANIEESRRYKTEIGLLEKKHAKDMEDISKKHQNEVEKIKNEYAGETTRVYDEKLSRLQKRYQEDLLAVQKRNNDEVSRINKTNQDEEARIHTQYQSEIEAKADAISRVKKEHQDEEAKLHAQYQFGIEAKAEAIVKLKKEHQDEAAKLIAHSQSEIEDKILEIRGRYDINLNEMRANLKRQFEQEFELEIKRYKDDRLKAEDDCSQLSNGKAKIEGAYKDVCEEKNRLKVHLSAIQADFASQLKKMKDEFDRLNVQNSAAVSKKDEYEKNIALWNAKENKFMGEVESLKNKLAEMADLSSRKDLEIEKIRDDFKLEHDNGANFESEVSLLKQKIQQMELQSQDISNQIQIERDGFDEERARYEDGFNQQSQKIGSLENELGEYKEIEGKFTDRIKWAFKKKGEE